jgi:hypothetical protein
MGNCQERTFKDAYNEREKLRKEQSGAVNCLIFSPDGEFFAVIYSNN